MRKDDIDENIAYAKQLFAEVKEEYGKSHSQSDKKKILGPRIATIFNLLRSTLDYCSKDIYEATKFIPKKPKDIKFPYHEKDGGFRKFVHQNFGDLKSRRRDIYDLLKSLQAFSGDRTVHVMCELNNISKHDKNLEQTRVDSKTKTITPKLRRNPDQSQYGFLATNFSINDAENVEISGVDVTDELKIENSTNVTIKNSKVGNVKIEDPKRIDNIEESDSELSKDFIIKSIDWASFTVKNRSVDYDVVRLMEQSISKLETFHSDLYKIL